MPLPKPKKDLKIAVFVPQYLRPEYTDRCIKALYEAQEYTNTDFFNISLPSLRKAILQFFMETRGKYDFICKVDNDCLVPTNWLNDIIDVFESDDVDILSPNVYPSDAAFKYGRKEPGMNYMKSKIVGGLWCMRAELIDDIDFYDYDVKGITGAFNLLKQIIVEKDPKTGWLEQVTFEDIGHWSGGHPDHIKTDEHDKYSKEVGRDIAWK